MRIPTRVLEVLDELAHWVTAKICDALAESHADAGAEFLPCGCSFRDDSENDDHYLEVVCEMHASDQVM